MAAVSEGSRLIATVNAGSATLKVSLFRGAELELLCAALVDRLDAGATGMPRASVRDGDGTILFDDDISAKGSDDALQWFFDWLKANRTESAPSAVGHRVVHGGNDFSAPALVTPEILERLQGIVPLAPLHLPQNLAPIRALMKHSPALPQVVCFDTAFHATQSRLERTYALPHRYFDDGIKKYGFHGLSYEHVASRLPEIDPRAANGRTVICHLGNGASVCALRSGRSMATSMGFTALEGLTMGTRCGSIDPGVLLHLFDRESMSAAALTELLYKQSGLLGLSGISSDMRDLLASGEPAAAEAVEHFCYRIARTIGSMLPVLGGLDAVIFSGGIGEHAAPVRERVCTMLEFLGAKLDVQANAENRTVLHDSESRVHLLVVPTNEELQIARHTARLLEELINDPT